MRAVNLLPERHRPRQPSGGGQGKSGYVLLGALGAVLVGVLVYVLTLNSINTSRTKITEATAEAARLNDQANSLYYRVSGGNVVIVSEPLDADRAHWKPVPPGHAIVAREGERVAVEPFLAEHRVAAE